MDTQPVGEIIAEPITAECAVAFQPPHRQFPDIQLHILHAEQDVRMPVMLKYIDIPEHIVAQQNAFFREQFVNASRPLSRIAAAALQDQPLDIRHLFHIINGDMLYDCFAHCVTPIGAASSAQSSRSSSVLSVCSQGAPCFMK
ncbi:hypothetical protein SDC9_198559 [bioreactor metagenome]|uniref:Uncharacterized protein n=1 Tax=bioreactor metagenome TaxID=1076179 RepID=A0A645IKC6_9ZZZZ